MGKKFNFYYLIVLLISTAAFPISVVAIDSNDLTDPSICHFNLNDKSLGSNHIQCDHCTYYNDHSDQVLSLIKHYINYSLSLSTIFKPNDYYIQYHFSSSPRSPPIS